MPAPSRSHAEPEGATPQSRHEAEELPLGGYAALATLFSVGLAALIATLGKQRRLPRRWAVRDVVVTGIATSRLARIITRDRVLTPLRTPFARYEGPAGAGEVIEEPRGKGLRRAIGTLITCPVCAVPWVATVSLGALALRPRVTRFVQAILVSVTLADFVQQLYAASRKVDA
jgi:hypothetical protein